MPESSKPSTIACERYIPELDGLRGIAIFMVMIHHFTPEFVSGEGGKLLHAGWVGVDLFFAISGFLITSILLKTRGNPHFFRNFYARRSLRIFPLYFSFLLIVFTAIPFVQGGPYFETDFLKESGSPWWYVLYSENIREAMGWTNPPYFLAITWSLCIEEHFYLIFPFLVACLSRQNLVRCLWSLVLISPLIRGLFVWLAPELERIQYVATICRFDVLSLGCLMAVHLATPGAICSKPVAKGVCFVSVMALLAMFMAGQLDRHLAFFRVFGYSIVAIAAASILVTVLLYRDSFQTCWLRTGPLANLGKISYGVYLLQRPAEIALLKFMNRLHIEMPGDAIWSYALKCGAAVGVAWLSWKFFEQPILRLKRRFPTNSEVSPLPLRSHCETMVRSADVNTESAAATFR